MIVLIHVVCALSSLVMASLVFVYPSKRKLHASYGLTGLTLVSGTYLVMTMHTALLHACVLGVAYLGVVSLAIVSARLKLAA